MFRIISRSSGVRRLNANWLDDLCFCSWSTNISKVCLSTSLTAQTTTIGTNTWTNFRFGNTFPNFIVSTTLVLENRKRCLYYITRRERLKSAIYLRLKKRKVFKICAGRVYEKLGKPFRDTQKVPSMLDKNRKPLFHQLGTIFFIGNCCIVPINIKWGDPLGFFNIHSIAKYQKTRMGLNGNPLETFKNFQKKFHSAEKKSKGATL